MIKKRRFKMGGSEVVLTGPDFKKGIPVNSLKSGEKILGHADGVAVLVIRKDEKFYAIGATCSHYSANLNDGILTERTLRCPWHHACFDIETGEAKKAPALNSLPIWETAVRDGKLFLLEKREPQARDFKPSSTPHFVIVGSGAAGHAASEMLRREGFTGAITVFSEDSELPYDRPNLSKDYLAGNAPEEWMSLRGEDFYQSKGIAFRLNSKVTALDAAQKQIVLSNGEKIHFDKCLLATGGTPVKPPISGIDQPHVHFLRSFLDCKSLIKNLKDVKKVVIIGAGFIGLESAAALKARGLEVTVVAPNPLPLSHVVGDEVGALLKSVHEKNGVQLRLGDSVDKIEKDCVVLKSGAREPADLVLVATGITPNIALATSAGIACENGILVNEFLETGKSDIFAAGDMARWPDPRSAKPIRVEHWVVAQRQGQTAARNMLGKKQKYQDVPFFWSQQFDVTINYVGHASSWTKTTVHGSLEGRNGAVAFHEGNQIKAVLTMGRDQQSLRIEKAFENSDQEKIKQILNEEGI